MPRLSPPVWDPEIVLGVRSAAIRGGRPGACGRSPTSSHCLTGPLSSYLPAGLWDTTGRRSAYATGALTGRKMAQQRVLRPSAPGEHVVTLMTALSDHVSVQPARIDVDRVPPKRRAQVRAIRGARTSHRFPTD